MIGQFVFTTLLKIILGCAAFLFLVIPSLFPILYNIHWITMNKEMENHIWWLVVWSIVAFALLSIKIKYKTEVEEKSGLGKKYGIVEIG